MNLPALTLLGILTIVGFYCGKLARLIKLPSLIGYMILGVLMGPSLLHLFDEQMLTDLSFITETALGFVAFSIGSELSLGSLRRLGPGIISIIFAESFGACIVVTTAVYALTRDLPMALIFGAMAPASAPAGTVAVIQECRSKGSLTKALYAVVGFDDGLAIFIFGFSAAIAKTLLMQEASGESEGFVAALLPPLREIGLSLLVGSVIGLVYNRLVRMLSDSREVLVLTFGAVLLGTGLSQSLHLSLILTNMTLGFVLVNLARESEVHFIVRPINDIMPLLFVMFFGLAGAHLKISTLPSLGAIGVVYIIGRSVGLVGGARVGAMMGRVEEKIKKYIGMGILSQAGVAIGLSLIVKHDFELLAGQYNLTHAAEIGASVITVITATSIVFEIGGPILTKIALQKAGEIPQQEGEDRRRAVSSARTTSS